MAMAATALRMGFITMASSVYLVSTFDSLRQRFVAYGPRNSPQTAKNRASPPPTPYRRMTKAPLDLLASLTVPHAWFVHFYVVSVASSLFWALVFVCRLRLPDSLSELVRVRQGQPHMKPDQVLLTWLLMFAQGTRRLYECVMFQKPSNSRMWIGHWLLGILFYLMMSVTVWLEGADVIRDGLPRPTLRLFAPSSKLYIGLPLFMLASGAQHDCHSHLASLKKYSLPKHPTFQRLIAPHYFAECVIYLALAVAAAPDGQALNRTIMCALAFVVVNLGVTSVNSRQWYAQKFGPESVSLRWNMIPFLF